MEWRAGRIPLIELAAYYGWLPDESATKAAQAGDQAGRRWSEREWMAAAQITYLQTLYQILWVGLRLKGRPPKPGPVKTPAYARPESTGHEQQRAAEHLARVAQLRKYSPTHHPAANGSPN